MSHSQPLPVLPTKDPDEYSPSLPMQVRKGAITRDSADKERPFTKNVRSDINRID